MHRLFVVLALFVVSTGCAKRWQNGECQTNDNCAAQAGYGKVCVQGRCQACGVDGDCQTGFVCRDYACVPRPECANAGDCGPGRGCQAGRCVIESECGPDRACQAGQACRDGKCVAAPVATGDPCDQLEPVYFDYDRSELRPASQAVLAETAKCFAKKHPASLRVEGNCDERGTAEYNVHLGQRRAEAVKRYLVHLGVPARALSVVSFGKEKPLCTERDEACWHKNRRADVRLQ